MKPFYITLTLFLGLISSTIYSQGIGINESGNPAHSSAGLDVNFNNKGFLPPRMTTAQRDAIQSPALGLQIYNTETNCLEYYRPNGWYNNCPKKPTVTTASISNISGTSATSGGNVLADGGAAVTARGVCWATHANPSLSDFFTNSGSGLGTFTSNLTGLSLGTTYYVRAFATNDEGTSYGEILTFTTHNIPTVLTNAATNVFGKNFTANGTVVSGNGAAVTARGIVWHTSPNPAIGFGTTVNIGSGLGDFSTIIGSLNYNTVYYVRAFATNSVGTAYGANLMVTTTNGVLVSFVNGSGSWTVPAGVVSAELLVVGGGGGGGSTHGGGGSGGRVVHQTNATLTPGNSVNYTIGNGGNGGAQGASHNGFNGGTTTFGSVTAIGGGYGGRGHVPAEQGGNSAYGGGSGALTLSNSINGINGTVAFRGGNSRGGGIGTARAGGGGGAAGNGGDASASAVGNGGQGVFHNITGTNLRYGSGGGGGSDQAGDSTGGDGAGNGVPMGAGTNGTANRGGGGGGGGGGWGAGGAGGSGVVHIRY